MINNTKINIPKKYQPMIELIEQDSDGYWAYAKEGFGFEGMGGREAGEGITAREDTQKDLLAMIRTLVVQEEVEEVEEVKTFENWNGNLSDYLQVGDVVDEEMYYYFLEALPPTTNNDRVVQIGEPHNLSSEGKETYDTLYNDKGRWVYKGHCHEDSIIQQK